MVKSLAESRDQRGRAGEIGQKARMPPRLSEDTPFPPVRRLASRFWASIACGLLLACSAATPEKPALGQSAEVWSGTLSDQVAPGAAVGNYIGEDLMIPMRDGVSLHAQVWRPRDSAEDLPILISRSPYGFSNDYVKHLLESSYRELADDGFIFVLQDIRGRLGSEGEFVNLRPPRADPAGIDESTDTYDTIDWLVSNLPANNGRAAVMGVSYGGWTAAMATIEPHPALKAISSQASPDDMFIGDDFHHNGALRLDYAWGWVTALETDGRTMKPFDFGGTTSVFDWYLGQDPIADLDRRQLGKTVPSWRNFVDHPTYDDFWRSQRTSGNLPAEVAVPNLVVAGWYDQEDFYGPLSIYREQEKGDTNGLNYLVVGPWNHGGWRGDGSRYGPFEFGLDTAAWFRREIELPWFRYWLKDEDELPLAEALIYQTGGKRWQRVDAWPPVTGVTKRQLYLGPNGTLSFVPPSATSVAPSTFLSDPNDPVPYRAKRDILPFLAPGSTWPLWQADDQAQFVQRDDVLFWQTEPLEEDLIIEGELEALLFASTTGTDADWVVKLLDIYPSDASVEPSLAGRQRMIAGDVFRGRFRESFRTARPLVPDAVLSYRIDLRSASHVFRKGHRIGVQVQSSWFPLISRNPQTFVDNILEARPDDFRKQTHSLFHDRRHPSAILLTVKSP